MSVPDHLAHVDHLRGLYRQPDAESLRRNLSRQADTIAAAVAEVANRPTPERCEQCAMQLEAVRRLVLTYRVALMAEVKTDETV
jgi:hypothetical protein